MSLCALALGGCNESSTGDSDAGDSGANDSDGGDSDAGHLDAGHPHSACDAASGCGGPCPQIACVAGAVFDADWPFPFEETQEAPITICHTPVDGENECVTGMLGPTMGAPAPDVGFGFTVPEPAVIDRDQTGHASVTFWDASGGVVYLRVHWTPWSNEDLADGDHYRVSVEISGDTHVLIDREVDYGTNELGSGSCFQSCPYINVNLRDLPNADGGVDDAGQ